MVRLKFLEGNVQLAISEMKISFPKIFRPFHFQLRYPIGTDQNFLGYKNISQLDSLSALQGA